MDFPPTHPHRTTQTKFNMQALSGFKTHVQKSTFFAIVIGGE